MTGAPVLASMAPVAAAPADAYVATVLRCLLA